MIFILASANSQHVLNLRKRIYHLKEIIFTQSTYCRLILASHSCCPLSAIEKSHLSKEHSWCDVSNEGILLGLVFDKDLALALREDVEMCWFRALLDDYLLWHELHGLNIEHDVLYNLWYLVKDLYTVDCA